MTKIVLQPLLFAAGVHLLTPEQENEVNAFMEDPETFVYQASAYILRTFPITQLRETADKIAAGEIPMPGNFTFRIVEMTAQRRGIADDQRSGQRRAACVAEHAL